MRPVRYFCFIFSLFSSRNCDMRDGRSEVARLWQMAPATDERERRTSSRRKYAQFGGEDTEGH